jgi:hypothetical protein
VCRERRDDESQKAGNADGACPPVDDLVREARVVQRDEDGRRGHDGGETAPGRPPDAADRLHAQKADGGEPDDVQQERPQHRCPERHLVVEAPAGEQGLAARLAEAERRQGETRQGVDGAFPSS